MIARLAYVNDAVADVLQADQRLFAWARDDELADAGEKRLRECDLIVALEGQARRFRALAGREGPELAE